MSFKFYDLFLSKRKTVIMEDVKQEIRDDYYLDEEDRFFDNSFGDDIDTLNSDVKKADIMEEEIKQLLDSVKAIESFGMTPTAFGVLKTAGLLSGTSLNALAIESFKKGVPDDLESEMALEAITDKIKETMVKWSTKILSFVKSMGDKVTGILSSMYTKISEKTTLLTKKVWDKAADTKQFVKAHPFKTVVVVLAAAAAVVAIAALVASGMPGAYANESALKSFVYKIQDMIGKIKWPFGKFATEVSKDGTRIICHVEKITDKSRLLGGTAAELGWTQTAVKSIASKLNQVWTGLKGVMSSTGNAVFSVLKKVDDVGGDIGDVASKVATDKTKSKLAGWASKEVVKKLYTSALWSVLGVLYMLLRTIVIRAFQIVSEAFNALSSPTRFRTA